MDITDQLLPLTETSSNAKLAISLQFKLLAALRSLDKLDDGKLTTIASALIVELPGVQERFETWTMLESLVPDFKRPEGTDEA